MFSVFSFMGLVQAGTDLNKPEQLNEPCHEKMSLGVCDQVRLKLACAATEASQSLEILDLASIGVILSRKRTTKMLIRLCGCAG